MKNVKDTGPVWLQAERWASGLAVALCMRISDLVSSLWKSHSSVMQISPPCMLCHCQCYVLCNLFKPDVHTGQDFGVCSLL